MEPNKPETQLGPVGPLDEGTRAQLAKHAAGRHPSTVQLVKYFAFAHLADRLRIISEIYAGAALDLLAQLSDGPELTAALRKLVESKDCAVRALVDVLSAD